MQLIFEESRGYSYLVTNFIGQKTLLQWCWSWHPGAVSSIAACRHLRMSSRRQAPVKLAFGANKSLWWSVRRRRFLSFWIIEPDVRKAKVQKSKVLSYLIEKLWRYDDRILNYENSRTAQTCEKTKKPSCLICGWTCQLVDQDRKSLLLFWPLS